MKVIIHCSDSAFGNAALIDSWHREKGWTKIGYQFVILNGNLYNTKTYDTFYDGLIETGRHMNETGAHCKGHNKGSIGICLIGKSGMFTDPQLNSLEKLLITLNSKRGGLEIFQHSDFDSSKPYCAGLKESYVDNLDTKYE
jgi:hypothetical protein